MAAVFKYEFQLKHFLYVDCEPVRFYQSQWFKNRWTFWGIKLVFLLYWLAWFITGFNILDRIDRWWIFLTNWGVMVILINFLLSFGIVTYGIFGEPASKTQPGNPVEVATVSEVVESNPSKDQSKQGLSYFPIYVWIFHEVAFGMALIITVAFWALLSPSLSPLSINAHAINLVIMFLDLSMSNIPIRLLHFYHVSLAGVTYTIFTLILHGAGYESAVYPNLDWVGSPVAAAVLAIILIFIAAPIAHFICFGLYHLRLFIARKILGENAAPAIPLAGPNLPRGSGNDNKAFAP